MATRTNDLTEFAKNIADDLYARMGSLKHVLSAGIMALADMTPEEREYYMAKAVGKDLSDKETKSEDVTIAENIETVKHFIRYKIPNDEEKRLIDSLRQLLTEEKIRTKKGRLGSKTG